MPPLDPDKLPQHADKQGRDPLHTLNLERMRHLLLSKSDPIIWEVADTWVVLDGDSWTIGADEPATVDQVRDLMIRADGVAKVLDCP